MNSRCCCKARRGAGSERLGRLGIARKCASQDEIGSLWRQLGSGGQYQQCGWLKDRFGLCWQIVPTLLYEMLQNPDVRKAVRAMRRCCG